MTDHVDPEGSPRPAARWWRHWRIAAVVAVFAILYGVGRATGWLDELDADAVRAKVIDAGPWGVLVFFGVFAAGELLHVPGMIFVAAGILAWGQLWGFVIGLAGSVLSVSVSFVVVRTVGGKALAAVERPLMRKMLDRLHARPITTIALLRAVFWMSPPLNYALALTSVTFRAYLIGSTLGLVVPVLAASLLFDLLFN